MTRRFRWWPNAAVYSLSIVLACIVVALLLPSDYRGGGGAVAIGVLATALVFRFVIWLILKGLPKRDETQKGRGDHVC